MATTLQDAAAPTGKPRRRGGRRFSTRDKVVLGLMMGVPALIHIAFVWFPAIASVALSFARWNGVGGLGTIKWVGFDNYHQITTNYPSFWPAVHHNLFWLGALLIVGTPLGLFLAILLDKEMKGSRLYQSAIYLPVVLSLALVGFIWQLIYSPDQGLINNVFHTDVDWLGDPSVNIWAIIVAALWKHVGYIMVLYLAGLKAVDTSLREAASMDGATEVQTFRSVVFPSLRPINIVVLVVTVIEALRAFDIVYIINKGRNGLELLSVLITDNIIGEASRIGFGSAIAVILLVISLAFIVPYLTVVFGKEFKS
ncbi:carbohydrate ABC transporter membrane protein 1 (CUT1 family) [Motilibacter rhizosphaerae]|uniref:Carbohydrate ABC transporter membrane protein 1 (CUT1 family) n=1 Tax=Motilibacter rhizosphaerae TaxID=598652 RepID=A0A4Q7NQX6_9ACTN|nr:sugar ABC transporter permease [Motilibacter rhizosphaerae]RZS87518.1 carbohydrate ABC transporter membrane protein 1 (CUT1 family) [Motilibacter rhizosphaerae]